MRRPSLTVRLVAGVVLAQLLLAGGLVWLGVVLSERQLREAFDIDLRGRLMSIAALVRYPEQGSSLVFESGLVPPERDHRHPVFYEVRSAGGGVIASTFPPGTALPRPGAALARYWSFDVGRVQYRGLMVAHQPVLDSEEGRRTAPASLTVYFAASNRGVQEEIAAVGFAIAGASLVLLILTSLLAAATIRRELHPLRALAQQAAEISPLNWEFHPNPDPPTELVPLIQALDLMLRRLHASYQQQREFLADAAHHLKTPVAILKSTLQALLRRPREADEYRAAAQASLLDIERLEQLLQRMLRLARLDQWADVGGGGAASADTIELGATCAAARERVQPLAESRGVELRLAGFEGQITLRADADDLELVWVNLLENAVQHSPSGTAVEMTAAVLNRRVRVEVRDQGQGISAEEAPHIFERFHRGAGSPPGGFGLGLAIARAIVQAYGGAIEVVPGASAGATFAVSLPLRAGVGHH